MKRMFYRIDFKIASFNEMIILNDNITPEKEMLLEYLVLNNNGLNLKANTPYFYDKDLSNVYQDLKNVLEKRKISFSFTNSDDLFINLIKSLVLMIKSYDLMYYDNVVYYYQKMFNSTNILLIKKIYIYYALRSGCSGENYEFLKEVYTDILSLNLSANEIKSLNDVLSLSKNKDDKYYDSISELLIEVDKIFYDNDLFQMEILIETIYDQQNYYVRYFLHLVYSIIVMKDKFKSFKEILIIDLNRVDNKLLKESIKKYQNIYKKLL